MIKSLPEITNSLESEDEGRLASPFMESADDHFRMLASIVEYSSDAIISKDLRGIIKSWNAGACQVFGYTEEEAIGRPITMLIPPDRQEEEQMILNRIYLGEAVKHFETIRVKKDGTLIPISLTISPVKNSKGQIIGASKIARDISDKVQLQQQLQEYAEKLKESNAHKDEFISIASHELKTPLSSIKAYLQLMERELKEGEHQQHVNRALHHVAKVTRLVSELLDISRIQSGKLEFNFSEFDFAQFLYEGIDSVRQTNQTHQIQVEGPLPELTLYADRDRLEQVLINLISNAIKYSPDADKVIVRAKKEAAQLLVSVQDFGIGIPDTEWKNVFSRFYRVAGLPAHIQGLGMGLYISSEIINGHKGKMWVESTLGKGSTFYFSLPVP